jgi:hypothetical protein
MSSLIEWLARLDSRTPTSGYFGHGVGVSRFLAASGPESPAAVAAQYGERLPARMAPVAFAEGGNLVLVSTAPPDEGVVYFWDHELEQEPPTEGNLIYLADSLDAFAAALRPLTDEEVPEPQLLEPLDDVTPALLCGDFIDVVNEVRAGDISVWFGADQLVSLAELFAERFPEDRRGREALLAAREARATLTDDGATESTWAAIDRILAVAHA